MSGFSLGFVSCYQSFAPVRLDSLVSRTKALYWMGDAAYMDGGTGDTTDLFNGESAESQVFNNNGAGAILSVGAATTANGVAGQLPLGAVSAITNGGTNYPASQSFTAYLIGQGGTLTTGRAIVNCTTNGSGVITSASVIAPGKGYTNTGGAGSFTLGAMNWTSDFWMRRFNQTFTLAPLQDLATARAAGYKCYFMPDDHERSNNWDFSTAQAPTGANTAAKVLDWWRTCNVGLNQVCQAWFDNQPSAGLGDIPFSMVGITGAAGIVGAADFPWWNMEHDYDADGVLTSVSGNPLAVRVLVIDCVSGKHAQSATDDASKKMIGTVQLAWLQARCLDAVSRGVKAVWVFSGKDLYNLDNQDGWGATAGGGNFPYITQRDALLTWGHTNKIPWVWICGDRHCAHAAIKSTAQGDAFDVVSVCPTPFGSKNGTTATLAIGNTPYPEMVWQHRGRDQTVHGIITWDPVNSQTIAQVVDNADDTERFAVLIPAGSRAPSAFRMLRA